MKQCLIFFSTIHFTDDVSLIIFGPDFQYIMSIPHVQCILAWKISRLCSRCCITLSCIISKIWIRIWTYLSKSTCEKLVLNLQRIIEQLCKCNVLRNSIWEWDHYAIIGQVFKVSEIRVTYLQTFKFLHSHQLINVLQLDSISICAQNMKTWPVCQWKYFKICKRI